ncbi:Pycsar system effector family protein [Chloroflexota bacterium]
MIFTFLCLSPRLKSAGKISPIYFGSIAREFRNSGEYYEYIQNNFTSEDEVAQSVAEQIHANSVISSKKYALVSWSIRFLMVGLTFWVIYFILRLI